LPQTVAMTDLKYFKLLTITLKFAKFSFLIFFTTLENKKQNHTHLVNDSVVSLDTFKYSKKLTSNLFTHRRLLRQPVETLRLFTDYMSLFL
jgi:hypothetical protein